jgi:hypothetical protein
MGKVLMQGLLAVGVLLGIIWGVFYLPHYIEWYKMDDVVKSTALTWTAFDQTRAKVTLHDELGHREITDVIEDDCTFSDLGDQKMVTCEWKVDIVIPLVNQKRRLRLDRTATSDMKTQRLVK